MTVPYNIRSFISNHFCFQYPFRLLRHPDPLADPFTGDPDHGPGIDQERDLLPERPGDFAVDEVLLQLLFSADSEKVDSLTRCRTSQGQWRVHALIIHESLPRLFFHFPKGWPPDQLEMNRLVDFLQMNRRGNLH